MSDVESLRHDAAMAPTYAREERERLESVRLVLSNFVEDVERTAAALDQLGALANVPLLFRQVAEECALDLIDAPTRRGLSEL